LLVTDLPAKIAKKDTNKYLLPTLLLFLQGGPFLQEDDYIKKCRKIAKKVAQSLKESKSCLEVLSTT
jgi:hypothetical protein